ncbi:acriflavin resistance protein [bacterium DOLZORAL124_64_63]|nr:MAG: acriflavin resistance protein [bacterium DOLZORAL124_64_63]
MNSLIRWFADNHVAANLLMLTILVAGINNALTITQQVFPEVELDIITVQVPYLGATPTEVEEAVCIRIEEQIQGVVGVKRITSMASEGMGMVSVELERGVDVRKALDDVKAQVDRIVTFPAETEKPIISQVERRTQVIDIVLYGDAGETVLKELADNVRDDLLVLDDITFAATGGVRPYEISIEVSEENLQAYGLTLEQVAAAVRLGSLDMPGGSVKTDVGEILVRTKGQRYTGEEFGKIIVITAVDGTQVHLDQIATVRDGFEDVDTATFIDGKRAALVSVYRTGDQSVLTVTDRVKEYVAANKDRMPPGIEIATWHDRSTIYRGRMNLLTKNGIIGLILVFMMLALTLEFRLALWVTTGLVIAILGAFWTLPLFGISLNMISMFAFIVSLGLVVDDAIVVGENVYAHRQMGRGRLQAAKLGTIEVGGPVTFAVATTVVAFLPLAFVDGMMGKFMINIPVVVISILLFSLVESLLILPAHLSTIKLKKADPDHAPGPYSRVKNGFDRLLNFVLEDLYGPTLEFALAHRALVVAIGLTTLITTLGWVYGGHIKFTFMPKVDADNLVAALTLPQGSTMEDARAAARQLEQSLNQTIAEIEAQRPADAESVVKHVSTSIGSQPRTNMRNPGATPSGAHLIEVNAELLGMERRHIPSPEMAARWRRKCGPVTGAVALSFSANLFDGGRAVYAQLSAQNPDDLIAAGNRLKRELAAFPGVTDITDTFREGKMEMKLSLRPEARTLGITLSDLARQVRAGFYGAEVMRIQRGRDEVKVMVRYPENERRSIGHIENMRVRTPGGDQVPFRRVARVEMGRGFASIERSDRQRVVGVTADVNQSVANAEEINAELRETILPALLADYPGLSYTMEGEQKERAESLGSLAKGFLLALLLIYALLAVLFKSYLQPVIVMSAIPFGIVGAIWGHILMGLQLTLISMFGLVALTGVVVNDSLIMIDFINRSRLTGMPMRESVMAAGIRRFRPIMLTSITTFAGLTPLILEKTLQAKFLIPMATSLGFGVIFATFITLVLVPVSYSILVDFKRWFGVE